MKLLGILVVLGLKLSCKNNAYSNESMASRSCDLKILF